MCRRSSGLLCPAHLESGIQPLNNINTLRPGEKMAMKSLIRNTAIYVLMTTMSSLYLTSSSIGQNSCEILDDSFYTIANFQSYTSSASDILLTIDSCAAQPALCQEAYEYFYKADTIFTAIGERALNSDCIRCRIDDLLVFADAIERLAFLFEINGHSLGGTYETYTDLVESYRGVNPCGAGGRQVVYEYPKINGAAVDHCAVWADDCGQPGADRFCKTQGFDRASAYSTYTPGKTYVPSAGRFCHGAICTGFSSVTCTDPSLEIGDGDLVLD